MNILNYIYFLIFQITGIKTFRAKTYFIENKIDTYQFYMKNQMFFNSIEESDKTLESYKYGNQINPVLKLSLDMEMNKTTIG